ncbi:FAD-dependent monooxygenase [Sphaerisporangium sp. NBC_01403]|uniref:FAD-dependent monooxygenase n=1 Tax=Sphaerisporangium sp. NBC_01403 TaxID=2903599 RepID=UPI0032543A26
MAVPGARVDYATGNRGWSGGATRWQRYEGLTLAVDLARRGVGFRIVDRSPTHPAGSRGKGLQPRTLEVFDDLSAVRDDEFRRQ